MIIIYTCPFCGKNHQNPPPPNSKLGYKLIGEPPKEEKTELDNFSPCEDEDCMRLYEFMASAYR